MDNYNRSMIEAELIMEAEGKGFKRSLFGFNKNEVFARLNALQDKFRSILDDCFKTMEDQERKIIILNQELSETEKKRAVENEALFGQVKELEKNLKDCDVISGQLKSQLQLSKEENARLEKKLEMSLRILDEQKVTHEKEKKQCHAYALQLVERVRAEAESEAVTMRKLMLASQDNYKRIIQKAEEERKEAREQLDKIVSELENLEYGLKDQGAVSDSHVIPHKIAN